LRERIDIDGMPLHVIDTAGLRDQANIVEQEGIRRARLQMDQADRVLLVEDASDATTPHAELMAELPDELPVTVIRNKIDLSGESAGINKGAPPVIHLSAKTGDGVDDLMEHLKQVMGYQAAGTGTLSARRRHIDALDRARRHVDAARQQLVDHRAGELMAEELRLAQNDLSEITGEFTSDDLLGEIFSSFCIGK
jgi:tRNA modification GTPase